MLEDLLKQRQALLDNAQSPLQLLRQLDRRLVLWSEQHPQDLALDSWRKAQGDAPAFWSGALRSELAMRLRACARDESFEQVQSEADSEYEEGSYWQMLACHSGMELPREWPEPPQQQLWAAMAASRRGQEAKVDACWQACVSMQTGAMLVSEPAVKSLLSELWPAGNPFWREWFFPLLLAAPEQLHPAMINDLAGRVSDASVIEAMGISGSDRFLPLLAEVASHGGEPGEVASEALQRRKAHNQDLGQRYRQWWASWLRVQGAPWSLFGGCW
ncbi:hypothetical protein [Marinobacter sp. S6332]|uniref:hypothetical protein n=1 Tax=Marinobacter sp. S6332 TaxID=2926403 RepID=UPI001FF0F945|nr:hypothetical protein [Marinobacter sp. S6332]MCK0165504.1 hypothetical protein [Marinobacter sp. S6332]